MLTASGPDRRIAVALGQNPTLRATLTPQPKPSKNSSMRRLVGGSGKRPTPAPMLSTRCPGSEVPGITTVTAGWDRMYFRKNCPQLSQSKSAAPSGNDRPDTARNSLPPL